MTPQQKADELVERFRKYAHVPYHDNNPITEEETKNAIQCAIICVEEILESDPCSPSTGGSEYEDFKHPYDFWQSVLNELKSRL